MSVGAQRPGEQRRIVGRYRLESPLGRGGMGTVWRAYDELLRRQVAVKELHVDTAAGTNGAVGSTLREARAVARVHHPHVVCVHDVVEEDGVPYIVMELVEGVSLAERLAARGPVDAREAARIGLALLAALREAHALGVLHRDLKPANVLLEEATGRVVLTDFGIAQLAGASTLTEAGMFVGSPEYTAPERMQGMRAGPKADLWSLGVLLCAAMTGRSPFHRDSLGGVLHAVVEGEIRPPAAAGPLLPVVRGLLQRDPARRIDAAEAERLLRAYVASAEGTAPSQVPEGPADRPAARPADGPQDAPRDAWAGAAGRYGPPSDAPSHERPDTRDGDIPDSGSGARSHARSPSPGRARALPARARARARARGMARGLPPRQGSPDRPESRPDGQEGPSRPDGQDTSLKPTHAGREEDRRRERQPQDARPGDPGASPWDAVPVPADAPPAGHGPRAPAAPPGGTRRSRRRTPLIIALLLLAVGAVLAASLLLPR
ncbi:protein kinase [Streptomyces coeruleoprunus]|uniref:non-specific serine/threonine protein kinase n=1 Tax=Streptomyces coeruleoprunus TaxID=285563 RepID=A0ABV9XS56_9ACTN